MFAAAGLEQRFWAKVDRSGDCWEWRAFRGRDGYGRFHVGRDESGNKKKWNAHRVAYELIVGSIPEGLDLDHLCRNRGCVNPAHLEPVTRRENLMRGETIVAAAAAKTHCVHGHEYTPENTIIDGRGRRCRECRRLQDKARWPHKAELRRRKRVA